MTKISKTKIEYGDFAWNPVIGCLRGCPYCWARGFAKRFWNTYYNNEYRYRKPIGEPVILRANLITFKPTFLEHNFAKEFPKKPSTILVGFMSDIAYWNPEWIERVLNKIKEYPQHKFVFLTKDYKVYNNYKFPRNCLLGITITESYFFIKTVGDYIPLGQNIKNKYILNIEPINSRIDFFDLRGIEMYSWIIIGAETGNRKGKIIPEKSWIESIVNQAKTYDIPVFLKDNLKDIWGGKLI
jgi:protein gp37